MSIKDNIIEPLISPSSTDATGVIVEDEGIEVLSEATTLNFTGDGVTASDAGGGVADITITAGGGVDVEDDGSAVATASTLNFTGTGVAATDAGSGVVDVAIDAAPVTAPAAQGVLISAAKNWVHTNLAGFNAFFTVTNTKTGFIAGAGGLSDAYRSTDDGVNWSIAATGLTGTWGGSTYDGNLRTVLVGAADLIVSTDDDGLSWTSRTAPIFTNVVAYTGADFGEERFVAVGVQAATSAAAIIWSADGATWAAATNPVLQSPTDVAFGGGIWVAVGAGVLVSTDGGENWVAGTIASTTLVGVTYGNDQFVAVDDAGQEIFISTDGLSWTAVATLSMSTPQSIRFLLGQYIALGDDSDIESSWDGLVWHSQSVPIGAASLTAAAASRTAIVVVSTTFSADVFRSTIPTTTKRQRLELDGESDFSVVPIDPPAAVEQAAQPLQISAARDWAQIAIAGSTGINTAVYTGASFIVAGDNPSIVYRSTDDGLTFSQIASPAPTEWSGSTHDPFLGRTVLVGFGSPSVMTSDDDGLSWTSRGTAVANPQLYDVFFSSDVIAGNPTYVAVGDFASSDTVILFSSDAVSDWTDATYPVTGVLRSVVHGDGFWVAVGGVSSALILVSPDGRTWTAPTIVGTPAIFAGVTFADGVFSAADDDGDVYQSADGGQNWAIAGNALTSASMIIFAFGQLLVGGASSDLATSWNGTTYSAQSITPNTAVFADGAASATAIVLADGVSNAAVFRSTVPSAAAGQIFESDGESDFSVTPVTIADAAIDIEDDGTPIATATTINFTDDGVTATDAGGGTVDVAIPAPLVITTSAPDQSQLFWDGESIYAYNSTNSQWLSTDEHSFYAGHPASITSGTYLLFGQVNPGLDSAIGLRIARDIVPTRVAWASQSVASLRQFRLMRDGVSQVLVDFDTAASGEMVIDGASIIAGGGTLAILGSGVAVAFIDGIVQFYYRYVWQP